MIYAEQSKDRHRLDIAKETIGAAVFVIAFLTVSALIYQLRDTHTATLDIQQHLAETQDYQAPQSPLDRFINSLGGSWL